MGSDACEMYAPYSISHIHLYKMSDVCIPSEMSLVGKLNEDKQP